MRRFLLAMLVLCTVSAGASAPRSHVRASAASGPGDQPSATASPRNANYVISVALDQNTRTLKGREILTWRNTSLASTSELRFHLYYNAWTNSRSTFFREAALAGNRFETLEADDLGWIDVSAIRRIGTGTTPLDLTGRQRYLAPDDGNVDDRTVMSVGLPAPAAPGETVAVEIEWTARVPKVFERTGVIGNYYFLGQWFPKIGVLEDTGWNCHQFHSSTEFFADYGVYDVSITVPKGWVVGATGRERERRDGPDSTTLHRYYQEDVHDFAWTTSPDYVERKALFSKRGLPPVEMRLLLQPEHLSQAERHFGATRAALASYGEWFGAYPYDHITIVDPAWQSGAGGMEYPTLFTAGTRWLQPAGSGDPEGVTVHECGHQFWYALVGNNEFEDAWLDEGLNTYSTSRVLADMYRGENHLSRRFLGDFIPWVFPDISMSRTDDDGLGRYRVNPRIDIPSVPSWRYWPRAAGTLSYSKTALWLHTLERHMGWPVFRRCLATYFERWKFRHPKPADFFAVINEVSGRDLTWFFDQVYRGTNVFDYGVDSLSSRKTGANRYETTVVVRRYEDGVFPVDVMITFANGERIRERWDGRAMWKAFRFDRSSEAVSAIVDPDQVLALDVRRTNNSRQTGRSGSSAATTWTARWMVWMQDLMLMYAFLV